jgi:gliding motility-associated-like protein
MKSVYSFFLILLTSCLLPFSAWATHNRAGEIHVRQTGPLTVEAIIITWTKASSVNADRDTLVIDWGDGHFESVVRYNGPNNKGVIYPNDIKNNLYKGTHTYSVPSSYKISMTDPNRIAGILNVNPPSSDNVPFHIETTYIFQDSNFDGDNTTPYLLQPPIDIACVNKPFKHNPNAYDPDGDSLSYEFTVPLQSTGVPVPNYSFPNQIVPGLNNNLSINHITGDITWTSPQMAGEYNLAFYIISWRDGKAIDTTIRDMQILVEICDNNPPKVATIDRVCVIAGDTVRFNVVGTDPDPLNLVQLSALGAPFTEPISPAVFTVAPGYVTPPVTGKFVWATTCEHIDLQPYTVVFKALDTLNKTTPQLADLKTVEIKVVGPPPEDVKADAHQGEVEITWAKPYSCEGAANNYFYGFSVWRKLGSNPFTEDTCTPGLAGRGYTKLITVTKAVQNGRYYFKDTQVERGRTYCYRVLAIFAKTSSIGYPFNLVESLPSKEVCAQLPRDLPLITKASVLTTDPATGQIQVCWSKPVAQDLDTVINHGPYTYQLLRGAGFGPGQLTAVPNASFTTAQFWQANDTCFTDTGLNTRGTPYHYQVAFYVGGQTTPLGSTNQASSVYLTVGATDKTSLLSWQESVPWNNYRYDIFRLNTSSGLFDSIGSTTVHHYEDRGLVNGQTYCYYVRSAGTYSISGVIDPIFNNSQEGCGVPTDTVPPCAPVLTVHNLCEQSGTQIQSPPYFNNLSWTNPNTACTGTQDAVGYKIWFAPDKSTPLTLLTTIQGAQNNNYVHSLTAGLAGCYAVSALDSVGNESIRSATVCVDNCPQYNLPNAFTPNGDGHNDLFTPMAGWRFIDRIDMQIFNRWGNLVFETQDPAINWQGVNQQGKEVSGGTYFYICKVYERRVDGVILRSDVLSGFIEVIR